MMCIVLLVYTDEINTKYKSMIQLGLLGGMGSVSTLVLLDKSLLLLIINIIIGTLLYKTLNKLKCKV